MAAVVRVVLAPVSLGPVGEGNDVEVVTLSRDRWPEGDVGARDPAAVAANLADSFVEHVVPSLPTPEPVGFSTESGVTKLIYTAPIAMSATLAGDSAAWCPLYLRAKEMSDSDAVIGRVLLTHWRRMLAETTAAFDLLPRYFTTSQVRSIYTSVWGEPRDWSNFNRWLHTANHGLCLEVPAPSVDEEVEDQLTDAMVLGSSVISSVDGKKLSRAVRGASRLIGMSPNAVGPLAGALGSVAVAAAITGGLVAYQRQVTRGKAPAWFTRSQPERVTLIDFYSLHPTWICPGRPA